MYRARILKACTSVSLALFLALASEPSNALSDDQLLDRGIDSYELERYLEAAMYLFAYQQRNPTLLKDEPEYAKDVAAAIEYSMSKISDQETELSRLEAQVKSRQGNVGSTVQGIEHPPPPLQRPPTCILSGRVIDEKSRKPLSGVTVGLWNDASGRSLDLESARTDRKGKFHIDCSEIPDSTFPLEFLLSRSDWAASELLIVPTVARKGKWRELELVKGW